MKFVREPVMRILLTILVVGLLIHRLDDFTGIRYVTSDDIDAGVYRLGAVVGKSPVDLAIKVAKDQGRINHLFVFPGVFVANLDSPAMYDFFNLGSFIVSVALMFSVISRLASYDFGLLFVAVFSAWLPQLWHHMPPAAYPLAFLPFIYFSLAFWCLDWYFRSRKLATLVAFSLFFLLALFSFELFLLVFPPLMVVITFSLKSKYQPPTIVVARALTAISLLCLLYLGAYVAWRAQFPSTYAGVQVSSLNLMASAKTVMVFSVGGFVFYHLISPYQVFFQDGTGEKLGMIAPYSLPDIFRGVTLVDYVAAAFATSVVVILLSRSARVLGQRCLSWAFGVGAAGAILSLILYGVSEKYVVWSAGEHIAYLGTRYAYFGWIVAACALLVTAVRLPGGAKVRSVFLSLIGLVVFLGSVSASYLNARVAATMKVNHAKWDAVRAATGCQGLYATLKQEPMAAPRLWDTVWYARPRGDDYWNYYTALVLQKPLTFVRDEGQANRLFDYRAGSRGELIGVLLGIKSASGQLDRLMVLTERSTAVQILYKDADVERTALLIWNKKSETCGRFIVNQIHGKNIRFASIMLWMPPVVPSGAVPQAVLSSSNSAMRASSVAQ